MAARRINYFFFEIVKLLQSCYQSINLYDSSILSFVSNLIDYAFTDTDLNTKIKNLIEVEY